MDFQIGGGGGKITHDGVICARCAVCAGMQCHTTVSLVGVCTFKECARLNKLVATPQRGPPV